MSNITINDFSAGLNTLFDPRIIGPNTPGEAAESPDMQNIDITARGEIITSSGFELVSSLVGSGGTKNLMAYEKDLTTRYLIIAHDDDYYSITPSSSVWTVIGDYGTAATNVGGVVYKGTGGVRRAILGNDEAANTTKKWDGTTFASLAGTPPDGWIMETFMGRLFIAAAGTATLYYSDVDDEDDFAGGGVIGFNDIITGLKAQGEFLIVYTRRGAEVVQFYYNDAFSLSTPLKKPFRSSSGCLAHKTVTDVYNDTYAFSTDGVQRFGADAQFIGQNLRVNSLSWKINPSITGSAYNSAQVERACAGYFKKQYLMALPYGDEIVNSRVFVYNYDFDAWTVRTGIFPSNFAIMPNSDGMDELYFAHNTAPELYKFVNDFSYAGFSYLRSWKSKIFNAGNSMYSKFWKWIDLTGSKFLGTVFYVDITVDGTTKTYQINDDNLETSSTGGYYGDDYLGDIYYGGDFAGQFKRWGARLPIPYDIRTGREIQITIRNSAEGQPWSVNYINIEFDFEAPVKIPIIFQQATLIS